MHEQLEGDTELSSYKRWEGYTHQILGGGGYLHKTTRIIIIRDTVQKYARKQFSGTIMGMLAIYFAHTYKILLYQNLYLQVIQQNLYYPIQLHL